MGPYSEVVLVCMYVCMSVRNGLRLKYTSLRIVYVPSAQSPRHHLYCVSPFRPIVPHALREAHDAHAYT